MVKLFGFLRAEIYDNFLLDISPEGEYNSPKSLFTILAFFENIDFVILGNIKKTRP